MSRLHSTLIMYQKALKFFDVLIRTASDKVIVDHTLSIEDLSDIQSMEQWLLVCTLSITTFAFQHLLPHCNKYISMDMNSVDLPSERSLFKLNMRIVHQMLTISNQVPRIVEIHFISNCNVSSP